MKKILLSLLAFALMGATASGLWGIALPGGGDNYTLLAKRDRLGFYGEGGDYDVPGCGGLQPVGYFNETLPMGYTCVLHDGCGLDGRLGPLGWNIGCGNGRCDPDEDYTVCPEECCNPDCTDFWDNICHIECNPYCGNNVTSECDGDAPNSCGDDEGDCIWCTYEACIDYSCTDGCFGARWRGADPVDNFCYIDTCTTTECGWIYTCSEALAGVCPDWECDAHEDCGLISECSSRCVCGDLEVKVGSDFQVGLDDDELGREDVIWIDKG